MRKALRILGVLLFLAGAVFLLFPNTLADRGVTYEYKREQLEGSLGIEAKYRRHLVIPLWASGLTAVAGLGLILIPKKKG